MIPVQTNCQPEEKKQWEKTAKSLNMSIAGLIRHAVNSFCYNAERDEAVLIVCNPRYKYRK